MKCPKCGFTGFDHLENCKKCGNDLTAYKARFNLRAPLFAGAAAALFVPPFQEPEIAMETISTAEATDFGYDFMEAEPPAAVAEPEEEFSFEEEDGGFGLGAPEEDIFAPEAAAATEAVAVEPQAAGEEGEFLELDLDLSWDEKPTETAGMPTPPSGEAAPGEPFDFPALDDLPVLDDLPPLEGGGGAEEAFGEEILEELGDLPEFEDLDAPGIEPARRDSAEGEPRDPFDFRGSVPVERTPGDPNPSAGGAESSPLPAGDEPPSVSHLLPFDPAEPIPRGSSPGQDPDAAAAEAAEPPLPPSLSPPAPLAPRLAAALADALVLLAAFALFVSAGELVAAPGEGRYWPAPESVPDLLAPYFLVLFLLCFGYFTLFHFLTGQSVGKMLLRLRVEGEEGAPLLFSQSFLRSSGGVLSLLPGGLGYVPLFCGGRPWSDRLAGTRVVRGGWKAEGEEDAESAHPQAQETFQVGALQVGVMGELEGDGGDGAGPVVVAGVDEGVGGEGGEAPEAAVEGLGVAAGQVGPADEGDEEGVAGEERPRRVQGDGAGGVPRGVQDGDLSLADGDFAPLLQGEIGAGDVGGMGGEPGSRGPQNGLVAAGVVAVPVGVDDEVEGDPALVGRRQEAFGGQ